MTISAYAGTDQTYFATNAYTASYTGGWTYRVTAAATRYDQSSGSHIWYNAPSGTAGNAITFTQAMTLDASGNLALGATSATLRADIIGSGTVTSGAMYGVARIAQDNTTKRGVVFGYDTSGQIGTVFADSAGAASNLAFWTYSGSAWGERARITSGGDLLVGLNGIAYNAERLSVYKAGNAEAAAFVNDAGANNYTVAISNRATTGDNKFVVFATESSDTTRGSIVYNRGTGLVTYATTSDYRAKDIIGPVANSGAIIDALKVYNGKMKGATVERPMLIAHEAQEFAPYAVVGEKDAVNENGDPVFQQMDVSSLVPLLIAEIQSLRARVAQLEQGA